MCESGIDKVLREGQPAQVKAWAAWYADLCETAGSVLLGRLDDALGFYDRGISVSETASAIAAGFTVDDYQEELDRMALERPEAQGPEWPDLTETIRDERDRDLEVAAVAAEANVADLGQRLAVEPAPRVRRPSMSVKFHVGSSWSG